MLADTIVTQNAEGQEVEAPLRDEAQLKKHIRALDSQLAAQLHWEKT